MGNLTNPVSLRIKSNLYWNSIWISYINNNYSYLLSTDYVLYSYLNWFITKKFFLNLGWIYFYSHYKLVRVLNTIFVIFFFKDYKFYRFVFEYLGLVLKLVAKNGRHINKKSRFNWYKLKKSVYKNYVSIKFLNYFKLKPKIKSNFFYTCCLYTFYLNQHKYVYDKNQKVKNPDKMQKNIDKKFNLNVFFINIYKLSNFLNLFYFTILLYLKKGKHLNILTVCYNYYLFFRKHKDFYFFWSFNRRNIYFFKSDNNTNIILFSECNKRNIRKRIYSFKRVVAKATNIFTYILKKKTHILFNVHSFPYLFTALSKFKINATRSNKNSISYHILKKAKYSLAYVAKPLTLSIHISTIVKSNEILFDLLNGFDFNFKAHSKYINLKRKVCLSQLATGFHKYKDTHNLVLAQRFFHYYAFFLTKLKKNKKFLKLKQTRLIYIKRFKIVRRLLAKISTKIYNLNSQKISAFLRNSLNQFEYLSSIFQKNIKKLNNKIAKIQMNAFILSTSFFFTNLFTFINSDLTAFMFFLQYRKFMRNQIFIKRSHFVKKFLLIKILFKIIKNIKYSIYFYYFKLYFYFYIIKFYLQINFYFEANLNIVRQLLCFYKDVTLKKNSNKKYTTLFDSRLQALKNTNVFRFKSSEGLGVKKNINLNLDKNVDVKKIFSNIYFKLAALLAYRKTLFLKLKLKYRQNVLSWKYKKYLKYNFVYNMVYPLVTYKRIIATYNLQSHIYFEKNTFKFTLKKNLNFFFKKYIKANKLNLVKPLIINTNIFLVCKNILRNLLGILQLKQIQFYVFFFTHTYYRYLKKIIRLHKMNKSEAFNFSVLTVNHIYGAYYQRKILSGLNSMYALNSNIFFTNFLKKIKNLFFFFCLADFNKRVVLTCLRDAHRAFFNCISFFISHFLEISKLRLFYIKYINLLINTAPVKHRNNFIALKTFNKNFMQKKYLLASIFARPLKTQTLKKFYYICKIQAIASILYKKKKKSLFLINLNILSILRPRIYFKPIRNIFFLASRFKNRVNLNFTKASVINGKRIFNVFKYLSKYFTNIKYASYYKIFRVYYINLLKNKILFYVSDLKLKMYFWRWQKKKMTLSDIIWLRRQSEYEIILIVIFLRKRFKCTLTKICYFKVAHKTAFNAMLSYLKFVQILHLVNTVFSKLKFSITIKIFSQNCQKNIIKMLFYWMLKKVFFNKFLNSSFIFNLKKEYYFSLYYYKQQRFLFSQLKQICTEFEQNTNNNNCLFLYTHLFMLKYKKKQALLSKCYYLYYKNYGNMYGVVKNHKSNLLISYFKSMRKVTRYKIRFICFPTKCNEKTYKSKVSKLKKLFRLYANNLVTKFSKLYFFTEAKCTLWKKNFLIYLKTLCNYFKINIAHIKEEFIKFKKKKTTKKLAKK